MNHRAWVPGPSYMDACFGFNTPQIFFWNNKNKHEWLCKNVARDDYKVYVKREPEFGWWIEFKRNRDAVAFKLYGGADETDNKPPT